MSAKRVANIFIATPIIYLCLHAVAYMAGIGSLGSGDTTPSIFYKLDVAAIICLPVALLTSHALVKKPDSQTYVWRGLSYVVMGLIVLALVFVMWLFWVFNSNGGLLGKGWQF